MLCAWHYFGVSDVLLAHSLWLVLLINSRLMFPYLLQFGEPLSFCHLTPLLDWHILLIPEWWKATQCMMYTIQLVMQAVRLESFMVILMVKKASYWRLSSRYASQSKNLFAWHRKTESAHKDLNTAKIESWTHIMNKYTRALTSWKGKFCEGLASHKHCLAQFKAFYLQMQDFCDQIFPYFSINDNLKTFAWSIHNHMTFESF